MKDIQTLIMHFLERAEPEEVIGLEPGEHLPLLDDAVHCGDHLRVLGLLVSLWKSGNKKNIIWEHSPPETMYIVSITKHVV